MEVEDESSNATGGGRLNNVHQDHSQALQRGGEESEVIEGRSSSVSEYVTNPSVDEEFQENLSLPSEIVEPVEDSENVSQSQVEINFNNRQSTIRSFRTRIDENGETVFDFNSDENVSSDSEHGEFTMEQLASSDSENDELDIEQPINGNVSSESDHERIEIEVDDSAALSSSINNSINVLARTSSPTSLHLMLGQFSESDSDDNDYIPTRPRPPTIPSVHRAPLVLNTIVPAETAPGSVAHRVASRRNSSLSGNVGGTGGEQGESSSSHTPPSARTPNTASTSRRGRPRKSQTKRRKRKTPTKKKKVTKPTPTPNKIPTPVKPLMIWEDVDLPPWLKNYSCTRCPVTFVDDDDDTDSQYYTIGEFYALITEPCNWGPENRTELSEIYPNLKEFTICINVGYGHFGFRRGENPSVKLLLISEVRLSEKDSALRTRPTADKKSKKKIDSERPILFVLKQHTVFDATLIGIPTIVIAGLRSKNFKVQFTGFDLQSKKMKFDIQMEKSFVLDKHTVNEIPYDIIGKYNKIFNTIFSVQPPLGYHSEIHQKEDIQWFYGQIKKYHSQENLPDWGISFQPTCIIPTLRQYQKNAVQWMLYREGFSDASSDVLMRQLTEKFLQKMYVPIQLQTYEDGILATKEGLYNSYVGYIGTSKPTICLQRGGILADEMGLGKTVEVICLILLNPCPENFLDSYIERGDFENSNLHHSDELDSENENNSSDSNDASYLPETKPCKRRKKDQNIPENNLDDSLESSPLHPDLRRRRKVSPCRFITDKMGEGDNMKAGTTNTEPVAIMDVVVSEPEPSTCTKEPKKSNSRVKRKPSASKDCISITVAVPEPGPSKQPKRSKVGVKKETLPDSPIKLYDRVKAIYDAELLEYSESRKRSRLRYNGTFFDTTISKLETFECICGGFNDNDRRIVVYCSICHSSQHAECVGFDKSLRNRFQLEKRNYVCPHCACLEKPLPAKTTLIVTPSSISHQWIDELKRHVKNKRMHIFFYKGVSHHGYIPPHKLAEYEIIITTYTVLTQELNYVDLPHMNSVDGRKLRNPKRFMTIPSPLPCVYWWRVCLDEAQMVEGIGSKMSLMAMRFEARNRWCITGTPINQGLEDLFGLFAFLRVEPVALDFWWQRLVKEPFLSKDVSLIYELFGQLIWRTSKNDALDQLGIPPQSQKTRWLNLSPIERHFYKQQYEICSKKILEKIDRIVENHGRLYGDDSKSVILQTRLSTLDRQTLQSLLQPFLQLRQACCHPQMVKGKTLSLQKGTLTMEELLAQLIKKTGVQCAEDHRLVVAALNGMAGIHMIKSEWLSASERYREVLQSAEEHKKYFQTDTLQLLHTMENLADLLDRNHEGIPFTLRDDSLRSEAEDLRKKYLEKYAVGVHEAQKAVEPLSRQTEEFYDQFKDQKTTWWVTTLSKAAKLNKIDDLISRIRDDLVDHTKKNSKVKTLANKFSNAASLQNVLIENLTQIDELRRVVLGGVEDLRKEDPSTFLHSAVSCHLRKNTQLYYKDADETGFRCQLCIHHDEFLRYESLIFKEEKKDKVVRTGRKWQQQKLLGPISSDLTEEQQHLALLKEEEELFESLEHVNTAIIDETRRGTWGDSDVDKILKILNNFARLNGLNENVRHYGSIHLKLLDAMKKEFRVLRILWRQIYDQISGIDELSQATTRLCLRTGANPNDNEPQQGSSRRKKPKELRSTFAVHEERLQNINLLERHEVDIKMTQMEVDLETSKENLLIHRGQMMYLETLKEKGYGKKGSVNSEDCPICQSQLGQEWSVLRCGHSYCSECVKKMIDRKMCTSFLCPLCRHSMKYSDVSFVDTRSYENVDGEETNPIVKKEIRGSHSTKVEAILELILELQETHPREKILIFSTWIDVLDIIGKALEQNEIKYCFPNQQKNKFQKELDLFKTREDIQALLMPLASGSKGLNIIEATHVIIVEPILSLASELQAIGRVHRIGQTKPTFVHRFYIRRTIEEQLLEVLKSHDVSADTEGDLTLVELQNLIREGRDAAGASVITL